MHYRMDKLPLQISDNENALPVCIKNRELLIGKRRSLHSLALDYFESGKEINSEKHGSEYRHLHNCPKCKVWLHHLIPQEVLSRQKRMSEYCCVGMFCAVEEHKGKRNQIQIEFTYFRNEDPCWMVEGKNSFIRFCPWCGKKLPEHKF